LANQLLIGEFSFIHFQIIKLLNYQIVKLSN